MGIGVFATYLASQHGAPSHPLGPTWGTGHAAALPHVAVPRGTGGQAEHPQPGGGDSAHRAGSRAQTPPREPGTACSPLRDRTELMTGVMAAALSSP